MIYNSILFLLLTVTQPAPRYTWKGKAVTYKQYRDSLKKDYLDYCQFLLEKERSERVRTKARE